jgi:hypothetical protein
MAEDGSKKRRNSLTGGLGPPYNDHIHFAGEDHVPQSRVKGLVIVELDVFRFVEAVISHRTTSQPIDNCLGFKLETMS